jgi:hypothetical protein
MGVTRQPRAQVRVHFDITPLMTLPYGRLWHKSDAELDAWYRPRTHIS